MKLKNQESYQFYNQFGDQLEDQLKDQLWNQLNDQLRRQLFWKQLFLKLKSCETK